MYKRNKNGAVNEKGIMWYGNFVCNLYKYYKVLEFSYNDIYI